MGGGPLKGLLLDTHIWWWYLTGSDRLPKGLVRLINRSQSNCWLSPISVWELGMLEGRGRIRINKPFRRWAEEALARFPVSEAPLNHEVALTSHEVRLQHPDPANRFLAATSLVYDLLLLTVDERLVRAEGISTRSK